MSISGIRLTPKSTLNVPTVGIPTAEKTAIEYNANMSIATNWLKLRCLNIAYRKIITTGTTKMIDEMQSIPMDNKRITFFYLSKFLNIVYKFIALSLTVPLIFA